MSLRICTNAGESRTSSYGFNQRLSISAQCKTVTCRRYGFYLVEFDNASSCNLSALELRHSIRDLAKFEHLDHRLHRSLRVLALFFMKRSLTYLSGNLECHSDVVSRSYCSARHFQIFSN